LFSSNRAEYANIGRKEMPSKKPTIKETVAQLQEQVKAGEQNRELLEEALYAVEMQLLQDGWISISATGGKELTKAALDIAEGWGRAYWIKNPLIRRTIELQALYVFAQGMTVKGDSEEVDAVVQAFMEDPKNYQALTSHQAWKQNERALATSGNRFFVFFTNEASGKVTVRTIPFSEIREVIKNPDDNMEPWLYRRDYTVSPIDYQKGTVTQKMITVYHPDWKYSPEDKPDNYGSHPIVWDQPVYHVKTNGLDDWTYGCPETISIIDWAKAYKRFLENLATVWEAHARIAQVVTTTGGPRAVAAAKAKYQATMGESTALTGDNADYGRPVGTTVVATDTTKFEPFRTAGSTTNVDDGRALRLMVGSGSGIPDQMLAADPSTGNLATAKAMERPLELQFKDRQTLWADVWMDILEYVIDQAIAAPSGMLHSIGEVIVDDDGNEIYTITALDEKGEPIPKTVSVTFPPILEHDVLATITALKTAATLDGQPMAGTMDMETLARQVYQALNIPNANEIIGEIFPDEAPLQMQTTYHMNQQDNAAAQALAMQAQGDMNQQIQADQAINQMANEAARELKEVATLIKEGK
jgi:hypothetical protein